MIMSMQITLLDPLTLTSSSTMNLKQAIKLRFKTNKSFHLHWRRDCIVCVNDGNDVQTDQFGQGGEEIFAGFLIIEV